jgi:hypothetical protein
MASTLQWAQFFSQMYEVWIDGIHEHDLNLVFTPRAGYCLHVTGTVPTAQGHCSGNFHLMDAQCYEHKGNNQKIGVLMGGHMQCEYVGKRGNAGYFLVPFYETSSARPGYVSGHWQGFLYEGKSRSPIDIRMKSERKRPDTNYPWN